MFNQVSAFLTQNNLLDSNQSGFRSGHSTETALLPVVEALRLARADSKSSILIFLDLSAAFDTVNHRCATRISACLTDVSCWMKDHRLPSQPCQDRTACGSSKPIISSQFHHPVRHINHNSFKNSQNLGVVIDDQLTLSDLLYSTSRISGPFFRNMLHNSLFKLLFCPGWTIAVLSWQVFQPVLSNLYN